MKDDLGKRMKENYEHRTRVFLPRRTYTLIRLDGKAFHSYTAGMKRPFDEEFASVMDHTAMSLCKEIQGANFAYTQSDEITILLTDFEKITTDAWFNGNVQKMVSVSASMASAYFNNIVVQNRIKKVFKFKEVEDLKLAFFDARVWTMSDPIEVENNLIWRQKDAVRNSISMHAQSLYSHEELKHKSQSNMLDMIHEKGENWNKMDPGFKRGRTIVKESYIIDNKKNTNTTRTRWVVKHSDFLCDRESLTNLIPKFGY